MNLFVMHTNNTKIETFWWQQKPQNHMYVFPNEKDRRDHTTLNANTVAISAQVIQY